MAGADEFQGDTIGAGDHGAYTHTARDPVIPAIAIAQSFQSIVSRNVGPTEKVVVSVAQIHTSTDDNIIPNRAYINGTVRILNKDV